MKRNKPSPNPAQQRSALRDHLEALTVVLTALRFSFSERSFTGDHASVEACDVSFMVDAFNGELGKLYEPMDFGDVVEESPVYTKICHVQGLVNLLIDGLGSVGYGPGETKSPCLDIAGIGRLIQLLGAALDSLRELINWKLQQA